MAYGLRERCAMIALMALNRTVDNAELDKKYKLGLSKQERERLNKDGLVLSQEGKRRSFSHELTDKGWAWVSSELSGSVPARAGSAGGALYALMNGLATALKTQDRTLAELFAGLPRKEQPTQVRKEEPKEVREEQTKASLAEQITRAYRRLAKQPRDWVYLRDLRPLIDGAAKAEVDSALHKMYHDKRINLTLVENQKTLTAADRQASIRLGVSDMHLISME